MSFNPTSTYDAIIYRPGSTSAGDVVATWAEVKTFIQASSNGKCIVYVDDSNVAPSPALVDTATGITDCLGKVEIRPYVVDSINFVVLQVEPGATLRNLYRVVSMELRCNAQNATPSLDFPLAPSGGNLILEEFGALTNASTATTTAINVAGGAVLQITGGQANIFLNNPAVPIFNVVALGLLEIVVFDASFIDANYASGGGRVNFVYDNATASSFATPGTPPPLPGITGGYDAVNDDNIWAQKPIDPATFNAPALNAVPVFNGTEWEATTVPSGSVTGTPNTMAYFNASGALTGTPTFVTAIDATGYLIVGATTTDNGSSARFQNTSLVANGSQLRSNQYGNNAGIGGLTAFKSRGAAIGTLAGLLAGDPILRFTSIGVAPDNASIPLASFITVQVPANFVPAGQNYVPTEYELQLVPLAGPINGHRVVFKVSSEGETQTLTGVRAGGPHTLSTNLTTGTLWSSDAVTPNGTIVGSPGDLFSDTTGGAGVTLWVKESGIATNTGWAVPGSSTIAMQTIAASGALVITAQDNIIFVDTSGGPVNLTLPTPTPGSPTRITFRDLSGTFGTNALTLTPPGVVDINGANAAFVVAASYPHIVAEANGVNYFI